MKLSLRDLAHALDARVVGDENTQVTGISSLESASEHDLVFVEDEKRMADAFASRAAAVVCGQFSAAERPAKPLLVARHPRLAFARAAAMLMEPVRPRAGVHASAVVASSARLGADVSIAPGVVIGDEVRVGDRVTIGPHVSLAANVRIGNDCVLHAGVNIYSSTTLGERVVVHAGAVLGSDGFGYVRDPDTGRYEQFPQVGRLEIGDDVEIGANATIDRGALDATVIGRGAKIDNLVHIGHNVRIGEDVVIAAQTGISGSAVIEKNVIIAGQVGIADHVTVEEGAILGAQSGVPSNKVIRGKGVVFWGTPARPIKQYLRELAVLARLTKRK